MVDSYLRTCQYSTIPSHLARFLIHGVFPPESTHPSNPIPSACSVARRWLLESLNNLDDLPNRVKSIIGRELAHHTRWTANATRTHHPTAPKSYDTTPLSVELITGLKEIRLDIPTSCVAVGLVYQLASRQRELRSAGPSPSSAASSPSLLTKLRQQKNQFLRDASAHAVLGRRVKIRSRLFTDITGQETFALLQDLLTSTLAIALTFAGSAPTTHPQSRIEDLPQPAQFILQYADALKPVDVPIPIEDDPSSL
jgi:hypothetical protein